MSDEVLTPRQLAEVLQLGESTVYRALEDGRLPGEKICGRWRTLHSQLIERVRDDRVPAPRAGTDPMLRPSRQRAGRFRSKVAQLEAGSAS